MIDIEALLQESLTISEQLTTIIEENKINLSFSEYEAEQSINFDAIGEID